MDLETIGGVEPPVDEDGVLAEVDGYVRGMAVAVVEPWRITNLGQAEWAMKRLAEAKGLLVEYRDQIALWQACVQRMERAGEWFEERLKEWGIANRNPSRKTLLTAHGTVATREQKPAIAVVDEQAALAWAREHCPEAVKRGEDEFRVSKLGDTAQIVQAIIGYSATEKASGQVQRFNVESVRFSPAVVAKVQENMGDAFVVEAATQLEVWDNTGPVPGLGVRPGSVTATVSPLL